jgi:hypothetical protein
LDTYMVGMGKYTIHIGYTSWYRMGMGKNRKINEELVNVNNMW